MAELGLVDDERRLRATTLIDTDTRERGAVAGISAYGR